MIWLIWVVYAVLGWVLPWWLLLVAGFLVGFLASNKSCLLRCSFGGAFLVWAILIGVLDYRGGFAAGEPLAGLLHLPAPWTLWLAMGLMAGLVSLAFAALGFWFKRSLKTSSVPA